MSTDRRVVVTGMAINTPVGDTLDGFLDALLAGRSAISRWKGIDTSEIDSKVGGDLSEYDVAGKIASLEGVVRPEIHRRVRRLSASVPWGTSLSMLLAVDGYRDAGLADAQLDPTRMAAIVAGHNLNGKYAFENCLQFQDEPDFIDALGAMHGLDTDHLACISDILGIRGPIYTIGGACASGNAALRAAVDEIRYHDVDLAFVVGAVSDFSPLELHGMALIGAISIESFNDEPERASRPFDVRREGFVPAHGGAALVLEGLDSAQRRDARIYAEVVGVETNADGTHLPQPSVEGQVRLMTGLLRRHHIEPAAIDYLNAHATSTPIGDLAEIQSIKQVFGEHAYRLKINATKSMLGHTTWSAPVVETVAAILQMRAGHLHPTINVDELDPEIDLDVCANAAVTHEVRTLMKTSFGFGGINCVSILRRFDS